MKNEDFRTFSGYMKKDESGSGALTASMEDYLEMVSRLAADNGFTRMGELSQALHVQPSSATRMVQRLAEMGYIRYEKYGFLMLTERGRQAGERLLRRHRILEGFMRAVGVRESEVLEETEKIEHMLSPDTAACFESFVAFLRENPEIPARYAEFRASRGRQKD